MDTRLIKIPIALAALVYTVYLWIELEIGSAIMMTLLTTVIGLLVFRSVRLIIAFFQLRRQKLDKASKWLSRLNPDKLWKKNQGYYYFLFGSVELNQNNVTQSEKYFKRALSVGLKQAHDKAACYLNLAMIAMAKQRKREAMTLISEAKKMDKKGMLKKDIKMVEKAMKSPQKVIRQRR
jgi:tetratricopeptide (TPR) repeat protein